MLSTQATESSGPYVGHEYVFYVLQVLFDLLQCVLLILLIQLRLVSSQVIGHDPIDFVFNNIQTLDVTKLDFLPGLLNELDLILHFVDVSLQFLFAPLIYHVDLLQTLGQLVSVPFDLLILGEGFVQLLRQAEGKAFNYVFDLEESLSGIIEFSITFLRLKAQLLVQSLRINFDFQLINILKELEKVLSEVCNSAPCSFDLVEVRNDV